MINRSIVVNYWHFTIR